MGTHMQILILSGVLYLIPLAILLILSEMIISSRNLLRDKLTFMEIKLQASQAETKIAVELFLDEIEKDNASYVEAGASDALKHIVDTVDRIELALATKPATIKTTKGTKGTKNGKRK